MFIYVKLVFTHKLLTYSHGTFIMSIFLSWYLSLVSCRWLIHKFVIFIFNIVLFHFQGAQNIVGTPGHFNDTEENQELFFKINHGLVEKQNWFLGHPDRIFRIQNLRGQQALFLGPLTDLLSAKKEYIYNFLGIYKK